MKTRRILSLLLALTLVWALILPAHAERDPIYDLALDSQGVYVFNPETGTAIYQKAENARMCPASTTKIMTALVVLEACPDPKTTTVTVPDTELFRYIIEDGGVHAQLIKGETFTVYDLLLGLMMNSFCDVADLLAYHFGNGDVSAFIAKMNEKAEELGLENTHFENAHGLHAPDHYSSPKDVATFLAEAAKNDFFREIISTRDYTIPDTGFSAPRHLRYTVDIYYEKSDYYCDAFVGGKSGFTDQAGRCLATLSEKDGVSYVSVLLGANMDTSRRYSGNMAWQETHTLITYAYEHFEMKTVLEKGAEVGRITVIDSDTTLPVIAGEEIRILTRKEADPSYKPELPEAISVQDVKKDARVGCVRLIFAEEVQEASYPLLLLWDGTPITTKSHIQKGAENAVEDVTGIFKTDKIFLTLLILLLAVVAICIPAIKVTQILHKKKSHKPKH
ncbi:MAG: D-alanyl-D-alanine carboxypeptidase [Clostridia bacterium]|nr:D-alanyl-D-alanine carboxypeptidase [Clostridia bacterium]